MIELAISEAQSQFTKILSKSVLIVDKKSHIKKAVLLPFEEYTKLIDKKNVAKEGFSKFEGILDEDFTTDDTKYNEILK